MIDEEKGRGKRGKKATSSKSEKDRWDKAEIVSKFLAAVLVLIFGIAANYYLQKKEKTDSNMKLYTQLVSNKETAENDLRKDMFGQILGAFLTPKDPKAKIELPALTKIREMQLNLKLLSRNFHESLDMKPLFRHLLMEIVRPRAELRKFSKILADCRDSISTLKTPHQNEQHKAQVSSELSREIEEAKQVFEEVKEVTNDDMGIDLMTEDEMTLHKNIVQGCEKVPLFIAHYNRELDLLVGTAKRVTRKEREVLEEVAGTLTLRIPLKGQPPDKICTAYRPIDWLPWEARICKTDEGEVEQVEGLWSEGMITFKNASGKEDMTSSRYFKMKVRYVYPEWKQVFVEILTCQEKEGCETRTEDDPEKDTARFWLEYFDFPLVDNTYLNKDQRYSVILEGFKEDENGEDEMADITLLYYPGAYAGLKEKSFYNNQLMRNLLKEKDLFKNQEN